MSKKSIIANWKANPGTSAEAEGILSKLDEWLQGNAADVSVVVCPPFIFLPEVAARLHEGKLSAVASLGAQDIALDDIGSQTGEVSGDQLRSLGVQYVIVGHSERRTKLNESDAVVHEKLKAALAHGIVPILCVEHPEQASSAIAGLDASVVAGLMVAYEPSWAISTNPDAHPDTPEHAAEEAARIREVIGSAPRMLYGGSVNPANAAGFLSHPAFDGVLVGAASLDSKSFTEILKQAV